jgi:hypothetical protein
MLEGKQPGGSTIMKAHTLSGLVSALALSALAVGCASADPGPTKPPGHDPSTLPAPPKGQGFQFKTDAFPVPAGVEQQNCYFYRVRDLAAAGGLPEGQPVNLHRVQMVQRDGSHHMNLFRVKTITGLDPAKGSRQLAQDGKGECFNSPNWADWPLIANTQQDGEVDWTFPDGVANVFQPDEWIMLQTHYVNASTQTSPDGTGEVAVNFYTMAAAEVKAELGTLFATKQSIRVCANNRTPTYEGSCQIKSKTPVNIIGANGHFHSRGKTFEMYSWDGTSLSTPPASARFYRSDSWDDPPMLRSPELNVPLPANGGVWYTCGYQWQPPAPSIGCEGLNKLDETKYKTPADKQDCCYTFGPIVDTNEHCNAFVYYYPKQDDVACF